MNDYNIKEIIDILLSDMFESKALDNEMVLTTFIDEVNSDEIQVQIKVTKDKAQFIDEL